MSDEQKITEDSAVDGTESEEVGDQSESAGALDNTQSVEGADQEDGATKSVDSDVEPDVEGDDFDQPVRTDPDCADDLTQSLVVNIDGYEGPLDVLLELVRNQKVDIRKISMMALVEQYLGFIEVARQHNLELAADYLVMASWLAYLKSKMLLPRIDDGKGEPTADEMAARLAFQLQRLEAMRLATENLFKRPRVGLDVFSRGAPEGVRVTRTPEWQADLLDLLKAYTAQRVKTVDRHYVVEKPKVFTLEDARARLARVLGMIPEWAELRSLSPLQDIDAPERSVVASAFHAALEFAKEGRMDLRQLGHFEPIYVRNRDQEEENSEGGRNEGGPNVSSLANPATEKQNRNLSSPETPNDTPVGTIPVVGGSEGSATQEHISEQTQRVV